MNIIHFPEFNNKQCLMMPYIQGDISSIPDEFSDYFPILSELYITKGKIGFLTIDESFVLKNSAQRAFRSKYDRSLHTEAGKLSDTIYCWGGSWGGNPKVTLEGDVQILLANNLDDSCAIWNAQHSDTTEDGDIGHLSDLYPYEDAKFMKCGEVCKIGIFTPHESLPLKKDFNRQFLRIVSSGVHGREEYFTKNSKLSF